MEYNKILVICIDRDADILKKVSEDGPIYGRNKLLDVVVKLGLADPADADTNALFEAIRVYDELKKQGKNAEVVALVGDENVGIVSDIKLSKQLDEVLEKLKVDGAVVITDGAEDEYVLPIIQSKVKVISLDRLIIKQSEQLESSYYVIKDFLNEVVNDPKLSRLLLGLPAIAAILYMLLGQRGWRLTVGVIGVFLLIKGFGLEGALQKAYAEIKSSFVTGKITFFTYAAAALIAIVGIVTGWEEVLGRGIPYGSASQSIPAFISKSIDLLMLAAIIALIGKIIDAALEGEGTLKYFMLIVFTFALRIILDAVSLFLLGEITRINFAVSIILGLMLSMFSFFSILAVRRPTKVEGKS